MKYCLSRAACFFGVIAVILIAVFAILNAFLGALFPSLSDNLSKKEIFALVNNNQSTLLDDIAANNFNNSLELEGITDINIEPEIIYFACGGTGWLDHSSYYGFYYTTTNNMTGMRFCGGTLEQKGNGFYWEEKDKGNNYYTEKICENFYYYEAHL